MKLYIYDIIPLWRRFRNNWLC